MYSQKSANPHLVVSALLRIAEPTCGKIVIDGVDIHTIGLHLLRSSLSVISQDAILLAGTIRYNLDPFRQYNDDWLSECLRRVGLGSKQPETRKASSTEEEKETKTDSCSPEMSQDSQFTNSFTSLDLNSEVKGNGTNISQGQRSLISIARALVRRSKIVILDEATASIDGKADAELQVMLNEVMGNATVLTVAHRLDTIIATCQRVVVMESGMIAEFGSVEELFSRPGSHFRALCDASKVVVQPNASMSNT